MRTPRAVILAAVKTVEPDVKRALAITSQIVADFRRYPQAEADHLYPIAGEVRPYPPITSPNMVGRFLWFRVRHTRHKFTVHAQIIEPRTYERAVREYTATIERELAAPKKE